MFDEGINDILTRDERYAPEAYEFMFHALAHTQQMLNKIPPSDKKIDLDAPVESKYHVSGRELMLGARALAVHEFGLMARTVLKMWGINQTDDFGNIVFNLIEAGLMSKTDSDTRADFHNIYDFEESFVKEFRIQIEEMEP